MKIAKGQVYWFIGIVAFITFACWLILYLMDWYTIETIKGNNDIAWFGNFGSFIGGLTSSAFGAIAFLGVLFSLRRQDIESKKSEKLVNIQIENSQIQQFEASFFSLLENHDKALEKITTTSPDKGSFADTALSIIIDSQRHNNYNTYHSYDVDYVPRYFIVLFQLLKFVDESKLIENKKTYTSLLRANIPNNVLMLLMFNCYVSGGNRVKYNNFYEYKRLIELYAMLEHISWKFTYLPNGLDRDSSGFSFNSNIILKARFNLLDCYYYSNGAFGSNVDLLNTEILPGIAAKYLCSYTEKLLGKIDETTLQNKCYELLSPVVERIISFENNLDLNKESILFHEVKSFIDERSEETIMQAIKLGLNIDTPP